MVVWRHYSVIWWEDFNHHHLQFYKALLKGGTSFGQWYSFVCACLHQMCNCVDVMLLFVFFMGAVGAEEDTGHCKMLGSPEFPLLSKEGDITIGAVFSIHKQVSNPPLFFTDAPERIICSRYSLLLFCLTYVGFLNLKKSLKVWKLWKSYFFTRMNLKEFNFAQTMIFAIEEINNSSSLLPNVSIGYKVFDSCSSTLPSTRAIMGVINGEGRTLKKTCRSSVHAIIGASESSLTIVMIQISGVFQIPMVNMCSFLTLLTMTFFIKSHFIWTFRA